MKNTTAIRPRMNSIDLTPEKSKSSPGYLYSHGSRPLIRPRAGMVIALQNVCFSGRAVPVEIVAEGEHVK